MTNAYNHSFTGKLIVVNISEATEAYKASLEDDEASLTSLIEKAAEVIETSPESMKELFNNLVLNKYFFSNRVP
ncbi:MAG: hypothetical protein CME68_11860 [Halobacteriovoraceae bacterium]|nr:hypothetical protein [Halobacteriovoraceae bacterium]|tara:strand:+ start:615 stop:836 length:222 start_codon:yes stop_codon:yes gene_type:complete